MTAEQAGDMATVLALPARPTPAARLPPAPLTVRLKTSPWLRRALPTAIVVRRAVRRAHEIWEGNPEARRDAIEVMTAIVAGTSRAQDVEELARAYVVERTVEEARSWQPWPVPQIDAQSAARVREALEGERGVLLSSCHTGPFFLAVPAFASFGTFTFTVAGPWFFEPPSHDRWGRRLALWQKRSRSRMILSTGSFPTLSALLGRGETVFLFFDMPGPRETSFLGKRALLADGTARLAMETGALVLPLRIRSHGHRARLEVAPALDPHEFAGAEELHLALAARHEAWILDDPAGMSDPRSFGWGDGATAEGWTGPRRPDRRLPAPDLASS
jgi:hypothetical protein